MTVDIRATSSSPQRTRPMVRAGASLLAIGCGLVAVMVYPFMPGRYDALAVGLSTVVQVFGLVGLLLVPPAALWLLMPGRSRLFATMCLAAGMVVVVAMAAAAASSVGLSLGVLVLGIGAVGFARLVTRVRRPSNADGMLGRALALHFTVLPLVALGAQLLLAVPVAAFARHRAIEHAGELIGDIEAFRAAHGIYPVSLQAQNLDYAPGVVGIAGYVYVPQGDTYNLSFELPRFLLTDLGAREWVVYNPRDRHRSYSHVAWLFVPDEQLEQVQGWYRSDETGVPHWRSFLFD